MAEIEPIEIINNPEIIEDKPIEIFDRRKIKKIKNVEEEPVEKIDKRKILRALWRTTILEDGTKKYNNKPCDPLYFKKYYDEKRKAIDGAIITCELCHREVTSGHIQRHQRSNICKKNYNLRLLTDEKPSEKLI
jgi:hypothetical protein